jgi:tryptophanase
MISNWLYIPRKVYTQSPTDGVAKLILVYEEQTKSYKIAKEPPILNHFKAKFGEIV